MKKLHILSLILLGFVLCGCSRGKQREPDIRVVDLKGLDAALAEHRGQGVLLDFWAIWCEPCVAELPELLQTAREYRSRGGIAIAVSYDLMIPGVTRDGVLKKMRAFVAEHGIDIQILIYDAEDYDAINKRFSLPGPVPATLAIDRLGTIVDRQDGAANKARFAAMLQKALLQK
jgi:thiol-disulfide isomerase/thioredoxin